MVPYLSVIPGTVIFSEQVSLLFMRSQALKFREWLGGEEKINEYCHDLAIKGGQRLAELLGTDLMDPTGEQTLNMVSQ